MPKVYNKHHKNAPQEAVYIGRGSKWGNPFVIGVEVEGEYMTREDSIRAYKARVDNDEKFKKEIKEELAGKDLVCFCAPKACHGDYLLEIANSE